MIKQAAFKNITIETASSTNSYTYTTYYTLVNVEGLSAQAPITASSNNNTAW